MNLLDIIAIFLAGLVFGAAIVWIWLIGAFRK